LLLPKELMGAFLWFVQTLRSRPSNFNTWDQLVWHACGQTIEGFHHFLFREIVESSREKQGRLRVCVIIEDGNKLSESQLEEYLTFQNHRCCSGFKMSVVLSKPPGFVHPEFPEKCDGIGFGDLLFVLAKDRKLF
jgi:hypothetical protein